MPVLRRGPALRPPRPEGCGRRRYRARTRQPDGRPGAGIYREGGRGLGETAHRAAAMPTSYGRPERSVLFASEIRLEGHWRRPNGQSRSGFRSWRFDRARFHAQCARCRKSLRWRLPGRACGDPGVGELSRPTSRPRRCACRLTPSEYPAALGLDLILWTQFTFAVPCGELAAKQEGSGIAFHRHHGHPAERDDAGKHHDPQAAGTAAVPQRKTPLDLAGPLVSASIGAHCPRKFLMTIAGRRCEARPTLLPCRSACRLAHSSRGTPSSTARPPCRRTGSPSHS